MSFTQPQIDYFTAYEVETSSHCELVPADIVGEISAEDWPAQIANYLEGNILDPDEMPETVAGYFYRLSAPGYLDCTEWCGPFKTYRDAMGDCADQYGLEQQRDQRGRFTNVWE